MLTDIYSAGEEPIAGVTLETLGAAIRRSVSVPVDLVPRLDDVVPAIVRVARRGDVVITLGAGSIGSVPDRLVEASRAEQARPRRVRSAPRSREGRSLLRP